jgi:hypothetical protein
MPRIGNQLFDYFLNNNLSVKINLFLLLLITYK